MVHRMTAPEGDLLVTLTANIKGDDNTGPATERTITEIPSLNGVKDMHTTCVYSTLLYNLKNRPIFIGLEPPRDQSVDCHIHWLARACRCILVTKIRFTGFPLWKRRD